MSGSPVLPLRPMTIGELLDTAAALLRSRWRPLLTMALTFAFVEQVVMTTLRMLTIEEVRPKYQGELIHDPAMLWLWIIVGLTTEIVIITLLSGPATRTAVAAVRGEDPERLTTWTLRNDKWGRTAAFAGIIGLGSALISLICFFPSIAFQAGSPSPGEAALAGVLAFIAVIAGFIAWVTIYSMFGLSVPALIADRLPPQQAFWRSPKLLRRTGGRTGAIRFLSYFTWLMIRLTITCGAILLLQGNYIDFSTVLFDYFLVFLGLGYLVVNTAGYAMMACVDAVTHIETRVRVEGLDVAVARMRHRGDPIVLSAPEAR